MTRQTEAKQERIIEAVRQGFDDDTGIVEFVHENGYALTENMLERHIRKLGGVERVKELLDGGLTNVQVLESCLPASDLHELKDSISGKESLRKGLHLIEKTHDERDAPLYNMTKVTLSLPSDLYEALRAASHGEQKSQNQLIVELLTSALSSRPSWKAIEPGEER